MRVWKRALGMFTAVTVTVTAVPVSGIVTQAAELFYSDKGLDLNIGRYNVGGGDCVGEVTDVAVNPKAQIFEIADQTKQPSYQGTKMQNGTITKLADAAYLVSDADFGITKGKTVGSFENIGWINQLGTAYTEGSDGDNLTYTVNAAQEGSYTVKLILTLSGTNSRDVAIRVNGDASTDQVISSDEINADKLASANSQHLFRVTFKNVPLQAGENTIAIGGKEGWALDFVRMAVVKSGDEDVLADASGDDFIAEAFSNSPPYFMTNSGCSSGAVDSGKDNLRKEAYHAFAVYMADVITHWAKEGVWISRVQH